MFWLFFLYLLLFTFLAWRNFKFSLGLFIILLPSYLIRFEYFGLPSNLLELSFVAIFLVWIIKYLKEDFKQIKNFVLKNRLFNFFVLLFFISSIMGIFVSDEWYKSLGQWRAFFFEPILFFVILIGYNKFNTNDFDYKLKE